MICFHGVRDGFPLAVVDDHEMEVRTVNDDENPDYPQDIPRDELDYPWNQEPEC